MIDREQYTPGPATGAQVRKDGEKWTLILVRELRHTPEKVWQALTDPAHLREWAPFDVDGSLGAAGATVKLCNPLPFSTAWNDPSLNANPKLISWEPKSFRR